MRFDELPMYRLVDEVHHHCSNVHNVDGSRGRAGETTRIPRIEPGERVTLASLDGPAVITRFWLTFDWPSKSPYPGSMLRNRSVRLVIHWEDADAPAIDVPVGDFFCHPLCYDVPFENALFADPTGRSSLCHIPMPFRRRATIAIVNDFDKPVSVFHDIRFMRGVEPDPDDGYLHACFQRTLPDEPGRDHPILPKVRGRGRYLGMHLGMITDRFTPLEWHLASPRFYIDDDTAYPSMMGASLDDFGGASWAYDMPYMHQDSGLIVSRPFSDGGGHFGMYFYHRRDPVFFSSACAVAMRPKVTLSGEHLLAVLREHPGLADRLSLPCTVDEVARRVEAGEDVWIDCGRRDDVSSVALYYLDQPDGQHQPASHAARTAPGWQWPTDDANTLRVP